MTKQAEETTTANTIRVSDDLIALPGLQAAVVEAIRDLKGQHISILDLSKIDTAPAQTFIVCQGKSTSQVSSIADKIREDVRLKLNVKPYNYDGYRNSQWIVIDYGDLMVHVFLPDVREFYNIEDLWSDARTTEVPDLD